MLLNNYAKDDFICVSGIAIDRNFTLKEDGSNFKKNKTRILVDNPYIQHKKNF